MTGRNTQAKVRSLSDIPATSNMPAASSCPTVRMTHENRMSGMTRDLLTAPRPTAQTAVAGTRVLGTLQYEYVPYLVSISSKYMNMYMYRLD